MQIHDILGNIYSMPEDSVQKLVAKMKKLSFVKGDRILQAGKVERNIFFVEKGIVRAYLPLDGKDVTFWIGMEGATVVSLKRQPYAMYSFGASGFLFGHYACEFEPYPGCCGWETLEYFLSLCFKT